MVRKTIILVIGPMGSGKTTLYEQLSNEFSCFEVDQAFVDPQRSIARSLRPKKRGESWDAYNAYRFPIQLALVMNFTANNPAPHIVIDHGAWFLLNLSSMVHTVFALNEPLPALLARVRERDQDPSTERVSTSFYAWASAVLKWRERGLPVIQVTSEEAAAQISSLARQM